MFTVGLSRTGVRGLRDHHYPSAQTTSNRVRLEYAERLRVAGSADERTSPTDLGLTGKIETIHRCSKGAYGSPTIHAELAEDYGIRVGGAQAGLGVHSTSRVPS